MEQLSKLINENGDYTPEHVEESDHWTILPLVEYYNQLSGLRVEQDSVLWSKPICPYTRVARYTGRGDSNDAANFECVDA